jgi:hypothetical protein
LHGKANALGLWVAQASGLSFPASRRKQPRNVRLLDAQMNCGNLWFTTKFGGTPNLTRETRVLP